MSAKYYEDRGTVSHGYTNQSFPTTGVEPLIVNYYDTYDFDFNGTVDYSYTAQGLAGENSPAVNPTGVPTGSKRLILGTTNWLSTYNFYDQKYRVIQSRSNNHLSLTIDNLVTNVYDFEGKVTIRKTYHNAGAGKVTTVVNKITYDNMGRVTNIYQNNNAAPTDQLLAKYEYNELGQLIDKKLHNTTGSTFLQSIDFRYNIQGWLTSINNAQLTNDSGVLNDEADDYFGLELIYEKDGGMANTKAYNGNISAAKWKSIGATSGLADQKSYKYTYDKSNWLKSAVSQCHTGSAWTKETNAFNESVTFDLNGNIKSLARNQRKHQLAGITASYTNETIDNLTYTYNSSLGDQLIKVEDATANTAGFKNGSTASVEYTYDGNGNLLSDLNKGVNNVVYNFLGKPTQVDFTDGKKIEYVYDAAGTKLTMKTFQGTTLLLTTDYIGGFVYENSNLSFFPSPEGRVVKNESSLEYQYAIADHQGNTRVVFNSVNTNTPVTATFENITNDATVFQNVNTSTTYWVTHVGAANSGTKVIRMNQNYKLGPSKSLKVFPGDKVDLEVYGYHENASGYGTSSTPLTTVISMVAGGFGGVSGGAGESGFIFNGVNQALTAFGFGANRGDSKPAAYLNYILFDKNYKVLDAGAKEAPDAPMTRTRMFFNTIDIKEAGYIFVYLTYDNASNNWVYFDDLKITHTKTNVIQYNEYYPFGLQASTSWTREDSRNDFLYNAGSELNQTSGWYETFYRNYDPAIGRFTSIDPLATKYASYSGYHYSYNSPVMFNDPMGAEGENTGPYLPENNYGGPHGYTDSNGNWHWYDPTGDAQSYANQGMGHLYQNWQSTARYMEDVNRRMGAQFNSYLRSSRQLQTVTGYFFSYRETLDGDYIPGTYSFDGFEIDGVGEFNIQNLGGGPGSEFAAAFGFATNLAELYRQGYGAVRFGTSLQNVENLLKNGKFINYNGKVYSNRFFGNQHTNSKAVAASKGTFAKSATTFKLAGKVVTGVGIAAAGYQFLASDQSGGDWARLGGSAIITGTAFIPVVGPFISIGLGIADSYGAFDSIYDYFDNP